MMCRSATVIIVILALSSAFFQGKEGRFPYDVSPGLGWDGWLGGLGPSWSTIQHPLAAFCEKPEPSWTSILWADPEEDASFRRIFCDAVHGLSSLGHAPQVREELWSLVKLLDMTELFSFTDDQSGAEPDSWWDVFPLSLVGRLLDSISDFRNNAGPTETTTASPFTIKSYFLQEENTILQDEVGQTPPSSRDQLLGVYDWLISISSSQEESAPSETEGPFAEYQSEAANWQWWVELPFWVTDLLQVLDTNGGAPVLPNEGQPGQDDLNARKADESPERSDVKITIEDSEPSDFFFCASLIFIVFCAVMIPVCFIITCLFVACYQIIWCDLLQDLWLNHVTTDTKDQEATPWEGFPTFCDLGGEFPMVILWAIEQFALIKDIPCVPKVIQGSSLQYIKEAGVVVCAGGGEFSKVLVAKMDGAVKVAVKLFKKTGCDLMDVLSEAATADWLTETGATPATYGVVALGNSGPFHELALVSEFIPDHSRSHKKKNSMERGKDQRSRFRKMLMQVVQLLQYIHIKRILHNNLSPDNIMMTYQDGHLVPYLTGFRMSSFRNRQVSYAEAESYTSFEFFHKHFPHVAPETFLKGQVTEQSDVYSMGGILLKHAGDMNDPELADVGVRCQAVDPNDRPSMDDLLKMLRELCQDEGPIDV